MKNKNIGNLLKQTLTLTHCHNHCVNDEEDGEPDAKSQAHVIQRSRHPAAPLCPHLVPDVVGFTCLKMKGKKNWTHGGMKIKKNNNCYITFFKIKFQLILFEVTFFDVRLECNR